METRFFQGRQKHGNEEPFFDPLRFHIRPVGSWFIGAPIFTPSEGPTEAEFEEMLRGMLKRDVARLNDALADNPNPGDGETYRTGHCPRLVLHVRTMAGDVSAIRGGLSFEARRCLARRCHG
jgi:hypothetical protein